MDDTIRQRHGRAEQHSTGKRRDQRMRQRLAEARVPDQVITDCTAGSPAFDTILLSPPDFCLFIQGPATAEDHGVRIIPATFEARWMWDMGRSMLEMAVRAGRSARSGICAWADAQIRL